MERGQHRLWVPQSTLETDVPPPLYRDWCRTLGGPCQAPLLKQALRWKTTPMGWDAVGQSWLTTPRGRDEEAEEPWYSLAAGGARPCWQRAPAAFEERDPLDPAYAQRLREVAWWDPIIPAAYLGPCTRWGAFLWQERPILGKEYVVSRSQTPPVLGGSSGYVPLLSFCRPPLTIQDIRTWSLLHHQPTTYQ